MRWHPRQQKSGVPETEKIFGLSAFFVTQPAVFPVVVPDFRGA
jgi:hypothetical protein